MSDPHIDPMLTARIEATLLEALEHFAAHEEVLVALDFDGTLAPLVDEPSEARMTPAAAEAVERLVDEPGVFLAVVSGRGALDLAEVASLPDDTLVIGSHGAQVGRVRTDPHGRPELVAENVELTQAQRDLLAEVTRRLDVLAGTAEGARVEVKPTTAVLHTRQCREADAERLTSEAETGPGMLEGTRTIVGKDVVEIGVLDVTKGDAVELLRRRSGATAAMYVGDDTTDEDAFRALVEGDLGVKVGDGATDADFRVANPEQAAHLLLELLRMRRAARGVPEDVES